MAGDCKTYQLALCPPWLLGAQGEAWELIQGLIKDAHAEGTREAVALRFIPYCPLDALAVHSAERQIERAPGEEIEIFRARLRGAWDAWSKAGTEEGILMQLAAAGITTADAVEGMTEWGGGFTWGDGTIWGYVHVGVTWGSFVWGEETWGEFLGPMTWARWFLIVEPPHPFTPPQLWGAGWLWGDATRWGFGNDALMEFVRRVIRKWQPAHVVCLGVLVRFDDGYQAFFTVN
jgi:hypothetical protein